MQGISPTGTAAALVVAAVFAVACSDDSTGPDTGNDPDPTLPASIGLVAGNDQEGPAGTTLPEELQLAVTDATGNPLEGVDVLWWVTSGGGSLEPGESVTDGEGVATTQWTLGPEAGEQAVEAGVEGLDIVTFTAEATPGGDEVELVSGAGQEGTVGSPLSGAVVIRVLDDADEPVSGVRVEWSTDDEGASVQPAAEMTDDAGQVEASWALGTVAGDQTVSITAGGLDPIDVTALAHPGDPSIIAVAGGEDQSGEAEATLPDSLVALVTDEHGNEVEGIEVTWTVTEGGGSVSPASDTSDAEGLARTEWTLGHDGEQSVEATIDPASVVFTATAASEPQLTSIVPATLVAGGTGTLGGANFSPDAAGNRVTVDGVETEVVQATRSELQIVLPPRSEFECRVTGPATVTVEVDGRSAQMEHTLQVARQVELTAGESLAFLDLDDVECNEIPEAQGGTYVLSAFNITPAPGATLGFALHGAHPTGEGTSSDPVPTYAAPAAAFRTTDETLVEMDEFARGHARVMEMNRQLYEQLGRHSEVAASPTTGWMESGLPTAGDTLHLRIPDIDGTACTEYEPVQARAVYVGTHGIVLEDLDAPLAGEMDGHFELIGEEFDQIQYGIVAENFGDPLAHNTSGADSPRVLMLFSEVVNDFDTSVQGFVSSADFTSRDTQCPSSDEVEIFYARVPTDTEANGFAADQPDGWRWQMRSTVIHEVKHLASVAARYLNGASFEESWLEEATARASEELYARAVFGYDRGDRTTYEESIHQERRPTWPQYEDSPLVMLSHFAAVYEYMGAIETLTPIGNLDMDSRGTFYGSGWLLTRWAADHHAADDAAFYSGLNNSSLSGVENLEDQVGLDFAEILADWTLSLAVDERPGFLPERPELDIPTWNTRDVFEGMNDEMGGSFPDPFPLAVREVGYGAFTETVGELRGGTAAIFELSGTQEGPQLLHLTDTSGGLPPEGLRAAIVRVD